jgi:hypothetical protein
MAATMRTWSLNVQAHLMIRSGRVDSPQDAPLLADAAALLVRPNLDTPSDTTLLLEEFARAGSSVEADVQHHLTTFSTGGLGVYTDHRTCSP